VRDFVVARYGEYVLLRPPLTWRNAALWLSGPAILLLGGAIAFGFIRRRAGAAPEPPAPLSAEEQKRLAKLLKE
jgi:cytochrome c-type biogenesis protein CcmH